ncbi:dyslexia-associated protein KIAA0319-like protein homolog [Ambystoma mexicanum]|uniref:dyslexia-associated protein KIAA0319-like protein homolog n=1 Tax=Ambystoma mexicanum TaxID=8296 RepID=UPI0037E9262C
MEKSPEDAASISYGAPPRNLPGRHSCWMSSLYLFTFLAVLFPAAGAILSAAMCQMGKAHYGIGLSTWESARHLHTLYIPHSVDSCRAACCEHPTCDTFWLLDETCTLADCRLLGGCRRFLVASPNSVLFFVARTWTPSGGRHILQRRRAVDTFLDWLKSTEDQNYLKRRKRRSLLEGPLPGALNLRRLIKRDTATDPHPDNEGGGLKHQADLSDANPPKPNTKVPGDKESPEESVSSFANSSEHSAKDTGSFLGAQKVPSAANPTEVVTPASIPALGATVAGDEGSPEHGNDTGTQPPAPSDLPATVNPRPGKAESEEIDKPVTPPAPTSLPANESESTLTSKTTVTPVTPAPPVVKELVVSAGNSVQVTLPKNAVELNAFVLPGPPNGSVYTYDWRLITHPKDYSGEMEGKHSQVLKLSKLTIGLYEFKVIVDGDNAHGEGFVNVTVNPEPRVNQPPVAIVSPPSQVINLPTTSTVIDGSQSKDDDKIVSYHWEELKGPLREEKVSADTAILKLTNLVPGNYTFSLTVVDSDGASNSTTANLTVSKAVDYPPVANAGAIQVITLPKNSITLYGNESTDDHGIASYEWSLSSKSKGKVVEMQGVRTATLQLSAMQEGDYTFQLTVTDSAGNQATTEVTVIVQPENNKPPEADAGPDKELTLPVDSTTLDGSKSTDDQKIASYLWEKTQGPDGVKIENSNSSVATVTGLQVGTYSFTLTVRDERNLKSQSSVNVIVREEMNKPPVAKIAGNVVITLPTSTVVLDGSKSSDDKGIVSYMWVRDEGSPAAGEVLNNSDHHPMLFLANLVEGTYTFHLKVTDAKGESDADRATVEVKQDPRKTNLVEMVLDVNVSMLTERQKGMFIRQIGVLLGVLDSDIIVQRIQPYTEQSTKMIFYVQNQPPHQIFSGHEVAWTLRNELHKQQSDFLIFRTLEINTVTCQLNCSDHGRCDSFTKRCICDPFWMENFLRVQLWDEESNCDWSVLYVVIASFVIVVTLGILSWTVFCCCKRRKGKLKRKSKYKMLDATDDQESMELKLNTKGGGKLKAPVLTTSLMHSESEVDSDEAIFTWPDREKGKLLRNQNGALRNGQGPTKAKNQREEIL